MRYRLSQRHKEQQGTSNVRTASKSTERQRSRSPHARETNVKSKHGHNVVPSVVSRSEKAHQQQTYSGKVIEMISSPSDDNESIHNDIPRSDHEGIAENSATTGGNKSDTEEGERKSTSSDEHDPGTADAEDHSNSSSSSDEEDGNKNDTVDDRKSKEISK